MKFLAALTVLALTGIGASTGQTRDTTQERAKPNPAHHKPKQEPDCTGTVKAIVYYRQQVWKHQDELGEPRLKNTKVEKRKFACAYKRWFATKMQKMTHGYVVLLHKINSDHAAAICYIFKGYCRQAIAVARCESGLSTTAQNGQYLGMFQMGNFARAKYGHGSTALIQAKAAYRYFVDSGRGWSPWSCKPW